MPEEEGLRAGHGGASPMARGVREWRWKDLGDDVVLAPVQWVHLDARHAILAGQASQFASDA